MQRDDHVLTVLRETSTLLTDASVTTAPRADVLDHAEPTPIAATRRSGAEVVPFSLIRREIVEFLPGAEGRIPLGTVVLLAGQEGLGKSMYSCSLAASLSRSGHETLFLAAEDSPGATLRPRLEAAGADLDHVHLVKMWREGLEDGLRLPVDAPALAEEVAKRNVRLVVIDPIMAHLQGGIDSHKDQSTRDAIVPLCRIASEHGCAVLLVMHLNKAVGIDALKRVGGSVAFTAGARSVLLLGRDPDDPLADQGTRRVLAHIKCNVAPLAPSQVYEIRPVTMHEDDEEIHTAKIVYICDSDHQGEDLVSATATAEQREERSEAEDFLIVELGSGERNSGELMRTASSAGISNKSLRSAYRKLGGLKPRKSSFEGGWVWELPVNETVALEDDQDAPASSGGNLGNVGNLRADQGHLGDLDDETPEAA